MRSLFRRRYIFYSRRVRVLLIEIMRVAQGHAVGNCGIPTRAGPIQARFLA